MANTFKSYTKSNVGTSLTAVYTTPFNTSSVCIGLNVSNTTGDQIFVDIKINKSNVSADDIFLIRNIPIPNGSSYEFIAGSKLVLESGDAIEVVSNTPASVDVLTSVLEQT